MLWTGGVAEQDGLRLSTCIVAPALLPTSIALVRSVDAATASGVYLTIYYRHHHFRMRLLAA